MFQYYLIMLHMFANSSVNLNKQSFEYVRIMENNRQKQSSRGVLRKWCSKNKQQIYRRTPIPKCDFNNMQSNFIEITLRHGCSPVNLLYIFRTFFPQNISERLLLNGALCKKNNAWVLLNMDQYSQKCSSQLL